jgi:Cu/Ag efflux pump CusA
MWESILSDNAFCKQMVDDSGHSMQRVRHSAGVHFVHTRGEASRSKANLTVLLLYIHNHTSNDEFMPQLTEGNVMISSYQSSSNSLEINMQQQQSMFDKPVTY